MVSDKAIRASNILINDQTAPEISIFVGGTSGVGKLTIKALVATGTSLRIYLIGRPSSKERTQTFIQEQQVINSKAEIIWIEGEISLLAEVKRTCEVIRTRELRVDLLFMTAGYAPFAGRVETAEGIEIAQSLEYYSRMLFIQHLLPLLHAAEDPRVISVQAGGVECTNIDLDDLDFKKPGNFTWVKAQAQYGVMNTTTMEVFAKESPGVTFIHSCPGWVNTGNVKRGLDPESPNSFMAWFVSCFLEPLIKFMAIPDEVSGQRHLFMCTSACFGGSGVSWAGNRGLNSFGKAENGLFLVGYKCDCTSKGRVVRSLREKGQTKVWEHMQEVLRPYL